MSPKQFPFIIITFLLLVSGPISYSKASHTNDNDGVTEYTDWMRSQSTTFRRNVKKLDDDPVQNLPIPVLFTVKLEDLTENFGDPRGGGTRTHEGLDILAPSGTPIVSPTKAVVIKTGSEGSAGKYVYTRNPGGETFVYMHLASIAPLKAGQFLEIGDVIGTVGDTGNAKGGTPHLHLEIRKSKPTDPFPRLTKEFTLTEHITFTNRMLVNTKSSKERVRLATSLVERYNGFFLEAAQSKIVLDKSLGAALNTFTSNFTLDGVPAGLALGSRSDAVVTLQMALMMSNAGEKTTLLREAGATGYFGSLTEAALREYQTLKKLRVTGIYDVSTRITLMANMSTSTPQLGS